jgi:hypothetical protein
VGGRETSTPSPDGVKVTIKNCPLCPQRRHSHILHIIHEQTFGLMTSEKPAKVTPRNFEVVLTCPNKNTAFKATIELYETSSNPIKRVTERRRNIAE